MSKKSKILIQLIVLIILIAGLTFYFYWQNKQSKIANTRELHTIKFTPSEDLPESAVQKYQERFNYIQEQIAEEPNKLTHWLSLAGTMKAIKSYQQAEQVWLYITEKWPEDPTAFGNLGDLYTNFLPDYPKAEEAFKQAIEKADNINEDLIYYRNLHRLYQQKYQEKADLADDILFEALEEYSNEPEFLALLANYYQKQGDTQKAIQYYEKLLKADPGNQEAIDELEELKY